MKKILTIVSVLSLFTFSANAFEVSDVTATVGISANQAVYGASGTETNRDESNDVRDVERESGVFVDSHMSGFLELNMGEFVSLGYEHTPDSISTPENRRITNVNTTTRVSVDFNDLNIAYLKLNIPGGIYVKAGVVSVDLDTKENLGTGSSYGNTSMDGIMVGVGGQTDLDNGMFIRAEANFMEFDPVSLTSDTTVNKITLDELNGVSGRVSIGTSF